LAILPTYELPIQMSHDLPTTYPRTATTNYLPKCLTLAEGRVVSDRCAEYRGTDEEVHVSKEPRGRRMPSVARRRRHEEDCRRCCVR